jgi:hypothetical protein
LAVLHGKGKYIGARKPLTDLSFPGFYHNAPTAELDEFPRAIALTEGHVVDKGEIGCNSQHYGRNGYK